jgi:hypothetical protein
MGVENLGMKTGIFFTGKSIGHPTHSIKLLGNLQGTSLLGAFEEHVLDEMGQTALVFLFVS